MGKLDLDDVVLAVMEAEGGQVAGRTRLQKITYFVTYLLRGEMAVDPDFSAHHYGPYSSALSSTVQSQVARGLLHETTEMFASGGFAGHDTEQTRYSYTLMPRSEKAVEWRREKAPEVYGKAVKIAKKICHTGADYRVLSYAAKAHFVLRQEGMPITREAIQDRAKTMGWTLTEEQLEEGVNLLKTIGVITEKRRE